MTTQQARSLLEAWPKRVPYFNGVTIIQCSACRQYFATGKARKAHRRNWTCNTTRLTRNDLGIWDTPARKRAKNAHY